MIQLDKEQLSTCCTVQSQPLLSHLLDQRSSQLDLAPPEQNSSSKTTLSQEAQTKVCQRTGL